MQSLNLCFKYTFEVHLHHSGLSQMCADIQPLSPHNREGFYEFSFPEGKKLMIAQNHSIKIVISSVFFQVIVNKAPCIDIHERKRKEGGRREAGKVKIGKLN